ncbi:hemin uptake protein HemP [Yersinia bercovieri]|uniref:Hemin uptake protein HemP n=2 Tax=Yersinia bercovieri TaxID=634 RepID=A0A2G4TZM3_YERBE|nr:hemin uptake protein HemP [Yersinia bercovieri]EEQ08462.1 Hemin uptake protein [Yersinia bercovieri ATCC 43970]MCB5301003.1 hemin uptake protein HemP [Yersinia bercovieri]MDN0104589.1 hemin uptake protein HemP [Yersinia bercovieri]PHZ26515.1 hemin uptake protein HemP [Yersinia bercovieri]QKJ08367.1 hemin uptake protein HemP [Yersinia bercovieri ATCC 43970]
MNNPTRRIQDLNYTADQHHSTLPLSSLRSEQLLGQQDVVAIHHQGQLYYLRQTKAGKLILTK